MTDQQVETIFSDSAPTKRAALRDLESKVQKKNKTLIDYYTTVIKLDKDKYKARGSCF